MFDRTSMLLAAALAAAVFVSPARAQSAASPGQSAAKATPVRLRAGRTARRAGLYYGLVWGVDTLGVKAVESGEIIRFTYRVLDSNKAKALNDAKVEPALIDPAAGVQLVVPSLEKVGQLRSKIAPVAGKSYWMAFSNKGRRVKRGDHVDVVIGQFRAEGLVVE